MRTWPCWLILLLAAALPALAAAIVSFEDGTVGKPPKGWTVACTGAGTPRWVIVEDSLAGGKVLKQSGYGTFPLCLLDTARPDDGFVQVRFRTLAGSEDRAAGLVWRYRDRGNYYVARANALEDNVVAYKVQGGVRTPLDIVGRTGGYGVDAPVPHRQWNTLRVDFQGNLFAISLNGKKLFQVKDGTFRGQGRVGLWTKADSVTLFDDFQVGPP